MIKTSKRFIWKAVLKKLNNMSESSEQFIPVLDAERVPAPLEGDWQILESSLKELNSRFQSRVAGLRAHASEGRAFRNVMDIGNNLIASVDILFQTKDPKVKTAENYFMVEKKIAALKKYFELLDNFPEFKEKEFAASGMAFPDIDQKYRGHEEAVAGDGYASYKEAYIYESAKILQSEHKEAA